MWKDLIVKLSAFLCNLDVGLSRTTKNFGHGASGGKGGAKGV